MREVDRLGLQELCGQLLVVGYDGKEPDDGVLEQIRGRALGGVILFSRNLGAPEAVVEHCRELHRAAPAGYPVFVGIDQEGGRVQRLDSVLRLPPMRALGKHDDPKLTESVAAELGRQLLALGFNLNFAPVADVDSNPDNPVIGDRSFSDDPKGVVRHARAFAMGLQSQGIVACLKHFPGHGDTHTDSHLELPTVEGRAVDLRRRELYPFERLSNEVFSMMTAHVVFPAFDRVPATLSSRLLGLLRGEFAFDGVVFSDDLEMKALSANWPIEDTAVRAVEAGCDVLLICRDRELQQRAVTALVRRAEKDSGFRKRCQQAVERSLTLRQRFPQRPKAAAELRAVLKSTASKALTKTLSSL